jgi:hypothetical protein
MMVINEQRFDGWVDSGQLMNGGSSSWAGDLFLVLETTYAYYRMLLMRE